MRCSGGKLRILLAVVVTVLLCVLTAITAVAQVRQQAPDAAPGAAEEAVKEDPLGRSDPQGTFNGYIESVSNEDYTRAAEYLDLSHIPADRRPIRGEELAYNLRLALDSGGNVAPSVMLSDEPEGTLDDGLAPDLEQIGTIKTRHQSVPLLLKRLGENEDAIWLIASETLQVLPEYHAEEATPAINSLLPSFLRENRWQGVPIGQWIAMLILAAASYLVSRFGSLLVASVARAVLVRKIKDYPNGLVRAFLLPVQLYLSVLLFIFSAERLGFSIIIRQYFSEVVVIVAWVAIFLLGWRLIDVVASVSETRASRRENAGALSAIIFFRRSLKLLLIAIGVITILGTVGIDVTTGLAALGIGGIAVALGAQKTIENLVGSVTLIFDQPVRVGDFCKVGETVGTVEKIGMRSTRIRTLDRTLVVIPNGDFSAQKIENYNHRDEFWYHPVLSVRHETTPDQIRYLLVEIRTLLYSHPKINPDPARIRFIGFGSSSLDLEIFAYILASDYDEFLEVQEDLNLRIADIVADSGTSFAFPSQTLYMAQDPGPSEDKRHAAEAKVQHWREQGELQIPKFDFDHINDLRGSISYPPEGSSSSKHVSRS